MVILFMQGNSTLGALILSQIILKSSCNRSNLPTKFTSNSFCLLKIEFLYIQLNFFLRIKSLKRYFFSP